MAEVPVLSVVIPCYNQGKYIGDALESIAGVDKNVVEVIIINDGSTDEFTNELLTQLKEKGHQVIFQENKGLGEARNVGVRAAKGKYILPLDADNMVFPSYITQGIDILDKEPGTAVVYGNAQYFGDQQGILRPGPFNLQRLMFRNYIDACAIIRKSAMEEVGLYDNMKIMGLEDWDLWLRIAFKGHIFRYVDETLFHYRVTGSSMLRSLNGNIAKQNAIEDYFIKKYEGKLDFDFIEDMILYRMKKKPFDFFYRAILKKFFPARFNRLIKENKIYKGHIYGRV